MRALTPRAADPSRVRPFQWAWQHRLLVGYLNLLIGDEGAGKGTFLSWLIAQFTHGALPGDYRGKPAKVLIVGDEDGFDNVWTPRLLAAGADLELVLDLPAGDNGDIVLSRDDDALRTVIVEHQIDVVVFDQFLDNLGDGVDDWRGKQVRDAVKPARRLAADLDKVLIGALHTNKNRSGSLRDRVSGTQQFNALSRSSLFITHHPEEDGRHVMVRGKGNYSKAPRSFEFSIESQTVEVNGYRIEVGALHHITEGDLSIDDVLGQPAKELTKAEQGRRIIKEELSDGEWHPAAEVLAALAEAGVGNREARRIATDLVERKKSAGFPAHALWRLPRGGLPVNVSSRSSHSEENGAATPATPVDRQALTVVDGLSVPAPDPKVQAWAEDVLARNADLADLCHGHGRRPRAGLRPRGGGATATACASCPCWAPSPWWRWAWWFSCGGSSSSPEPAAGAARQGR